VEDAEFLQQLREAFAIEAEEHLQAMTTGFIELEKTTDSAQQKKIVETIFRQAHSLKGAARAVNRTDIEAICQALESVFAVW
jgi:two-component system chemotaxis sensor kinase CheA